MYKRKGISLITIILICIVIIIAIAIITNIVNNKKEENNLIIDYSTPNTISEKFVYFLINNDFENAFKCVYIPNDSYIDVNDFKNYILNHSNLSILPNDNGYEIKNSYVNSSADMNRACVITLENNNRKEMRITINTTQQNSNWMINLNNFSSPFKFTVPKDSDVYLSDSLVNKNLKETKENTDIYSVPSTYYYEKDVTVKNQFGETNETININETSQYEFEILPSEDTLSKAYEFIKLAFKDTYTNYTTNFDASYVQKYFNTRINASFIKDYLDQLTLNNSRKNFEISYMSIDEKNKSYCINSNLLKLNFAYTMRYGNNDANSMSKYSTITLEKINDTWKIYNLDDSKFLTYFNPNIKEF